MACGAGGTAVLRAPPPEPGVQWLGWTPGLCTSDKVLGVSWLGTHAQTA